MNATRIAVLLAALAVAGPTSAAAHAGLHAQIEAVSADISRHPGDADLHLVRAHLHRLHGDWAAAGADLDAALRAGADPDAVLRARAAGRLDRGFPALALGMLADAGSGPGIRRIRMEAYRRLGLRRAAVQVLEEDVWTEDKPHPDKVLKLCDLLDRLPERGPRASLRVLRRALERSGPVPAFVAAFDRHSRALEESSR